MISQWGLTIKWVSYPLVQAGTFIVWPVMCWKGIDTNKIGMNASLGTGLFILVLRASLYTTNLSVNIWIHHKQWYTMTVNTTVQYSTLNGPLNYQLQS